MGERVYKASELKLPCTIEYTRHADNRGSLMSRKVVVERQGQNLRTECGDWLWWPTINYYNDVHVVEESLPADDSDHPRSHLHAHFWNSARTGEVE